MQEPRHVLVIEDDPDIAQMLALNLRDERHHLLILDLMLPGMDGWSVCREVRQMPDYVPIIIVSAKDKESHRVLGLELGADDYVTKPFSLPELVARVRAVLRRMDAAEQLAATRAGMIRRGGLTIDPLAGEARLRGESVTLTAREFDLLLFFARNPDRVFNWMELLDQVWGYSHDGYEHTVNSHINRLRMKIEANPARPVSILTVWGVGYKFVAAPEES